MASTTDPVPSITSVETEEPPKRPRVYRPRTEQENARYKERCLKARAAKAAKRTEWLRRELERATAQSPGVDPDAQPRDGASINTEQVPGPSVDVQPTSGSTGADVVPDSVPSTGPGPILVLDDADSDLDRVVPGLDDQGNRMDLVAGDDAQSSNPKPSQSQPPAAVPNPALCDDPPDGNPPAVDLVDDESDFESDSDAGEDDSILDKASLALRVGTLGFAGYLLYKQWFGRKSEQSSPPHPQQQDDGSLADSPPPHQADDQGHAAGIVRPSRGFFGWPRGRRAGHVPGY